MAVTQHTDSSRLRSESPQIAAEERPRVKKKRKHDAIESGQEEQTSTRVKKRPKDIDEKALDSELNVNHAIAHMNSSLMADHIAQRTKRFRPDLSVVESDEYHIPGSAIHDTTAFEKSRIADHLPEFIEHTMTGKSKKKGKVLSESPPESGSPHTIIVAASGLRAADLTRAVRKYQSKNSMVAKLFAKHIKLKEASDMVKQTRMGIGVGTPQRIFDLIQNESLKLSFLERIVIDASHIDQKKRGILDIKEIQMSLIELLSRKDLRERYADAQHRLELLFF